MNIKRYKKLEVGVVDAIHDNGSMVVKLDDRRQALAYPNGGRKLEVDRHGLFYFSPEATKVLVEKGDRIAFAWDSAGIKQWTVESSYEAACLIQQSRDDVQQYSGGY